DGEKILRQEMQTRLRDIGNAAERLERAGLQSDADARLAAERRRGAEGVAAVVGLPPCTSSQSASESSAGCSEGSALHASVCAIIPATAVVAEVQVFTRLE